MVEHGLIESAHPAEISVSDGRERSKYAPLVLPISGDVTQTIAVLIHEGVPVPHDKSKADEFMLMLGEGDIRVPLVSEQHSGVVEVKFVKGADDLLRLVLEVNGLDASRHAWHIGANDVGDEECEDIVVQYRLYSRPVEGQWHEQAHGPLTFRCGFDATEEAHGQITPVEDAGPISPRPHGAGTWGWPPISVPSKTPSPTPAITHKFDHGGGFDGTFLAVAPVSRQRHDATGVMKSSQTVVIDPWDKRSKYVSLLLPIGQDVDVRIGSVRASDAPSVPEQFMLVLGEDVARIPLKFHAGEISAVMTAAHVEALAHDLLMSADARVQEGIEVYLNDCRDVVIGYRLLGRALAGRWVEYAHGPLVFKCPLADATDEIKPFPRGEADGPFMTKQAPAFMPQFMSDKGEKA